MSIMFTQGQIEVMVLGRLCSANSLARHARGSFLCLYKAWCYIARWRNFEREWIYFSWALESDNMFSGCSVDDMLPSSKITEKLNQIEEKKAELGKLMCLRKKHTTALEKALKKPNKKKEEYKQHMVVSHQN